MTHDLTLTTRSASQTVPAGVIAPARWLFGRLVNIGKWFVAIVLLSFLLVPVLVNAFGGSLQLSIWEMFATNGPGWFSLAMGATLVANYLTVMVAQGVTRGRFALAAALAIAAFAVLLALFVWLGYGLESFYFQRFQWQHDLLGEHLFSELSQGLLVTVEYSLRHVLFALVGMIVGYGYYRFGGVWGTFLLPFTLVVPLAIGITILGLPGLTVVFTFGGISGVTPVGAGLVVAYFVVLLSVCRYLLMTLAIKTKVG